MKKIVVLSCVLAASISLLIACTSSEQPATGGEEAKKVDVKTTAEQASATVTAGMHLFKQHCAVCHRDGGNIIKPQKTLHKDVREKNGIKTAEDIIRLMRNPGPGMQSFDETDVPDKDAKAIAEYILKTF